MPSLKVAEYDLIEKNAIAELPNRIIEAFQPVTFLQLGYPTRVRSEYELFKYIDVMQETRFEHDYSNFLGGITETEFELLQKLTSLVCNFSEAQFQRKGIARSSLIRMINVLRHIQYLFGDQHPRILEIGPGCGYLGAMLMLLGYPYAATDVTQAFYLYQNHLWDFISGGKIFEGVKQEINSVLREIPTGSVVHFPWWEFVKLRPESVPQFDVITCNHALCEMHPDSLRFILKIVHSCLLNSQEIVKAFIFEGWGWKSPLPNKVGSVAEAADIFYRFGFSLVYNDSKITVFAPSGTPNAVNCCPWEELSTSYVPHYFSALKNPLSQAISLGRQKDKNVEKVKIDTVNRFYSDLLGSTDHLTPDEHFLKLIGRKY